MVIIFKNGSRLEVPYIVAESLRDNMLKGAKDFQCFSNEVDQKVVYIINLTDISHIYAK